MELKEVVSSNVKKVGYDDAIKDLIIEYNGGSQYAYHNVPKIIVDQLFLAESVGRYVNENIKGFFNYTKIK